MQREQQRITLDYFESIRTVPAGWDHLSGAYLAFGDAYARELDNANQRQWPTLTLPAAGHLHQLTDPHQVASSITHLLRKIGITPDL